MKQSGKNSYANDPSEHLKQLIPLYGVLQISTS